MSKISYDIFRKISHDILIFLLKIPYDIFSENVIWYFHQNIKISYDIFGENIILYITDIIDIFSCERWPAPSWTPQNDTAMTSIDMAPAQWTVQSVIASRDTSIDDVNTAPVHVISHHVRPFNNIAYKMLIIRGHPKTSHVRKHRQRLPAVHYWVSTSWVAVCGRVNYISVCNRSTRSTQPSIPRG